MTNLFLSLRSVLRLKFRSKLAVPFCLLLALPCEPASAAPPAKSATSSSSPTSSKSSSVPLTRAELEAPLRESVKHNNSGNYRRALLVLQSFIDANANKPVKIRANDWHLDETGQNLALSELSPQELSNLHFSDVYNTQGISYTWLKQYPNAETSFRKSIALNPQNASALTNMSGAYCNSGRLDDCLATAGKALRISDRFLDAHRNRATAYRAKGQFDLERKEVEAYNRCRKLSFEDRLDLIDVSRASYMYNLISQKPPSVRKLIALGVVNSQLHKFAESEKCHLAAIKLDGKLVEAHWSYGLLLMAQKRYTEAIKEFDQAIALDAKFDLPYFKRAEAYTYLHKYSEAVAGYTKFLEMNSKNEVVMLDAYFNRSGCYGHLKQHVAGIKDLNKALTFDNTPNVEAQLLASRGVHYQRLGNKTQALKDYDAALELAPNNKEIYELRGRVMLSLGEYEQATVDLSRSQSTGVADVSKEPPSATDLQAQIVHYDKLIKMFPKTSIDSLYNRGLLYLTMGDALRAGGDMQSVVALSKEGNATADYAACYGSIALRMQKKAADADKLLQVYGKKPRREPAPPEVQTFLNGTQSLPSSKLMLGDAKQRTRVLTLLGLDAGARGDKIKGRQYLSSVLNTGDPSMDEFALAVSYLKRLGKN
ncbi:tetratricopeptide repeat protein [bacterium]|nr:tetratricopeptide repeat protein [bacterium]MBP9810242.1 tetratricopeptide repeat protein [bacterium]